MSVERTDEQTGPNRLLSRRSLLRGLTGGALAAVAADLTSQPGFLRTTTGLLIPSSALLRVTERLITPKSVEADPLDKYFIDHFEIPLNPARSVRTLAVTSGERLTAESITTTLNYPFDAKTYAIDMCTGKYFAVGHPDWDVSNSQYYFCHIGFSNRSSDTQVLNDTDFNPSINERIKAAVMGVDKFDYHFAGGHYTYGLLETGSNFLDMGNSNSYSNITEVFDASLDRVKNRIEPIKYVAGKRFPIIVFVGWTTDKDDLNKLANAGRLLDRYGAVFMLGYPFLNLVNGKLDLSTLIVLGHESYHAKGLTHNNKESSIMSEDALSFSYWLLTQTDLQNSCSGSNIPDRVPIETLNKTVNASVILNVSKP